MKRLILAALLVCPLLTWAQGEHCHVLSPSGAVVDAPAAKDKKVCEASTGTWFSGDAHCHKAKGGKLAEVPAKGAKECAAAGGTWMSHAAPAK